MYGKRFGIALFALLAAGACKNESKVPGVGNEKGGASPGLGSGTDSSGAPDWMNGDGKSPKNPGMGQPGGQKP